MHCMYLYKLQYRPWHRLYKYSASTYCFIYLQPDKGTPFKAEPPRIVHYRGEFPIPRSSCEVIRFARFLQTVSCFTVQDLALSKELALVLSCCFGSEPLQEIEDLPVTQTSIRIGKKTG